MRSALFAAGGLVFLLASPPAGALDLAPPIGLETTATLPQGIRNPRLIDVRSDIDTKWDGTGQPLPLGQPLNRLVKWGDVLTTKNNPDEKAEIQAALAQTGMSPADSPGQTTGQVNSAANIFVPVLAYGITDRLTFAVAVPVVNINVSQATGFVANPAVADKFDTWLAQNKSPGAAGDARTQLSEAVAQKLAWAGYQPLSDYTVNHVGDTQLVAKLRFYDDAHESLAFKAIGILPTGTAPNPDLAIDVPTGDGAFGLGGAVIHDMKLAGDLRWNSWAGYTGLLPHSPTKRIPYEIDDPISPDKEELHENLKSLIQASTGIEKEFVTTGISVGAGYTAQYLSGSSYDPGALDPVRYSWLEGLEPSQTLHSLVFSAGFSSVDFYKAHRFGYPFQAHLAYALPIAGRNATTNDLVSAELVLFF